MAGSSVVISGVCVLLLLGSALGGRLRTSGQGAGTAVAKSQMPGDAIKRVIQMLDNLIAEMDAEQKSDEQQFAEFQGWCTRQQEASTTHIGSLDTQIEELTASLAQLYARKVALEDTIAKLNADISETQTQIATATQKREEEHASFIAEQTDFDNSIAACNKAITILSQHYGDGSVQAAEKPSFMKASFAQVASILSKTVVSAKRLKLRKRIPPALLSFIQGPYDRYEAKTGDALDIVSQMKVLGETFQEDKENAIDEENRLNGLYTELMTEKTTLLNSLITERNEQQAILNAVNQDIAEQESAKANAEAERKDEQAYLAQVKKSCTDTAALFEQRQKDRAAEKMATQEAIKVLGGSAGAALTQVQQGTPKSTRFSWIQQHASHKDKNLCPKCTKAAALLSRAASSLRSTTLATAAAATMGSDAVQGVISALNDMLANLAKDAQMEKEHKEWCEHELSATQAKKASHEGIVAELKQKIADTIEDIAEKEQAIQDTTVATQRLDKNFEEATALRAQEKQNFESELQDYNEAITALNQAISILSEFYSKQKASFLQSIAAAGPRELTPGVFDSAYEQKGGAGIVEMISTVRKEYEQGKADLEAAEAQAVSDYAEAKKTYQQMRSDLVTQMDRLTVEKQTAESNLDQFQDDKASNEAEIQASITYLGQLANSCNSLLANFDARVKHRNEEKGAIEEAIRVLQEES